MSIQSRPWHGPEFRYFAFACAALLALASTLPNLHEFWWPLELFGHFLPHIAVASALLLVIAVLSRSWWTAALATGTCIFCVTNVIAVPNSQTSSDVHFTLVSQNLLDRNGSIPDAIDVLKSEAADIVVLQEYTPLWHESIEPLADAYATSITVPREGAFGIAAFSKLPITSHEVLALGDSDAPAIAMHIDAPGHRLVVIAVHLQPPMTRTWVANRNRQLDDLTHYLAELQQPYLVVGDFNNTPYASTLRSFLNTTRARVGGKVWLPTWPAPFGVAGIPIDLAIGSADLSIASVTRIESIGSDHRGIRVSIGATKE